MYSPSRTIILAEEYLLLATLMQDFLKRNGVCAIVAPNGLEAIRMANKHEHDLIIMDIKMPLMGGMEATRILRSQGYTKPIIGFSGGFFKEDVGIFLKVGMNDFLPKPCTGKEIIAVLDKFL